MLHSWLSPAGYGLPFNLRDVAVCLRGLSALDSEWGATFKRCLLLSGDREAVEELRAQSLSLGRDLPQCLSGLLGAVDRFQSPLVNAYAPEICFEDVLERDRLVYVQLPSNLFKLQAPALGKCMLMDLQQQASLRQVFREKRNQRPASVCVDEFGTFADISIIDSLNKLRDAHIQFTLSHQSMADLEIVSKEFAQAVWDNTRTKDILAQDNPEPCERIAKNARDNASAGEHGAAGARPTLRNPAYGLALDAGGRGLPTPSQPTQSSRLARTGLPLRLTPQRDDGASHCLRLGQLPLPSANSLRRIDQATAPGLRLNQKLANQGKKVETSGGPDGARSASTDLNW